MGDWKETDYLPYADAVYPLSKHYGGPGVAGLMQTKNLQGLVIHITDGNILLPNLKGTWENRTASAHFAVDKNGIMAQYVPLSQRAWAVDGWKVDNLWYSVENVAVLGDTLTDSQIWMCAYLLLWVCDGYQVPLQLARNPDDKGLGYHSLFTKSKPCPGQPVIDQLPEIIRAAKSLKGQA